MKELSIEQKAQAYDNLIKRLKDFQSKYRFKTIDEYFPELKKSEESKDEKIRKAIGYAIGQSTHSDGTLINGVSSEEALSWLEKQGEQKTVDEIAKEVCKNKASAMTFLKSAGIINEKGELAEQYRQDEQKPADKVKPKIKAGDWVVCNNGPHHIFQVIERSWPNAKYRDLNGTEIFLNVNTLDKQYHLWTIQDAKDGDVLACGNDIVIFKENSYNPKDKSGCMFVHCSCNNFYEIGGINPTDYKPATKEQRDLLFSKMKEAGYEWDAEKKELKKIEQKPAVWSDEDEEMLKSIKYHLDCDNADIRCYGWIEELKDRVQPQPKQEWSEDDEQYLLVCKNALAKYQATDKWDANNISNWLENKLKSLRPQPQWKPSDEQLDALESATENCAYSEYQDCLRELIGQLKKLREDKL